MLAWLKTNVGSIAICLVLAAAVAMIIRKLLRDRRMGKTSCGCGCANCAMNGACHSRNDQ